MRFIVTFLLMIIINIFPTFAQEEEVQHQKYAIQLKKAVEKIKLDGKLTEKDWQNAQVMKDFYQSYPDDKGFAKTKTEVRLTYDDKFIYVAAICYDEMEGNYVVQSLKRDFSFPITDAFGVFLDPFNNKTAGFSFAVSPMGVQREGLVQNGGQYGVTTSWDNKWFSKVEREADRWTVEMAIPFKSIRYNDSELQWRINFARNDLKRVETSTYVPVPTQYNVASLGFTAPLNWDAPPPKAKTNIALIPYVSFGANKDYEASDSKVELNRPNAGFDAKIAVTSSLNLDITVNPDFSQVEVDRQVTNLERFSIFFPERRNFFLENSDLFNFGISPLRPFFSRRIGLSGGRLVPILAGARLTGNLDENWRIGVLNIQTEGIKDIGDASDSSDDFELKSQNYGVATIQRKVFDRSTIGGFLINRQAFNGYQIDGDDYNRVGGTELNFRSKDNKWNVFTTYYLSFTQRDSVKYDSKTKDRQAVLNGIEYTGRNWYGFGTLEYAGKDYVSDMGFTQELYHRNDETGEVAAIAYLSSLQILGHNWYPEKLEKVRSIGLEARNKMFMNMQFSPTDYQLSATLFGELNDQSRFSLAFNNFARKLYFPLNATGKMDSLLVADTYHYNNVEVAYVASKKNKWYGTISASYGGFYNGNLLSFNADMTYRWQPLGNFSLNVSYNDVTFPEGFGNSRLLLIGPRAEFTFNRSLFWTTFLQYNTQSENFNINSRLQWRFAPMSDVFLVFTDNMNTTDFSQKNWGIVLKMNYWLAL